MVKIILQIYLVIPAENEAEREALRPIGRNVDRYHQTIRDLDNVARAADKLGPWGAGTVDQIREQFVEQWKQLPTEYIMWVTHFAQEPKDHINMEAMMKEIKPARDELTQYPQPAGVPVGD